MPRGASTSPSFNRRRAAVRRRCVVARARGENPRGSASASLPCLPCPRRRHGRRPPKPSSRNQTHDSPKVKPSPRPPRSRKRSPSRPCWRATVLRMGRASFSRGQYFLLRGEPSVRACAPRSRTGTLRARRRHLHARSAMLRCRRGDLRKPAESFAPSSRWSRCSRDHLHARRRTRAWRNARMRARARSLGFGARCRASAA